MSLLQEPFDKLFNELINMKTYSTGDEYSFSPSCDITEDAKGYTMKFDMPGVAKENIKVEAVNDRLTVSAERKEEKKTEDKKRHLSEVYYGSYQRSFVLPSTVDPKKVDAKFENGVLMVTIPKTETLETRAIAIH